MCPLHTGAQRQEERGSAMLSRLCRLCELGMGGDGGAINQTGR